MNEKNEEKYNESQINRMGERKKTQKRIYYQEMKKPVPNIYFFVEM